VIYFILSTAFMLRAIPRLFRPGAIASDTYFHLAYARAVKENRFWAPRMMPRVVLNPHVDYPPLYHIFLALFPEGPRAILEQTTGAIFDTLNILLTYLFSQWVLARWPNPGLQSLPLWVAAILATFPALLRIGSGPRAYHGSERIPAQTLYLVHLLAGIAAWQGHSPLLWAVCVIAGAGIVLTAQFGHQVMWFFSLVLATLFSAAFLGAAAASTGLAVVITGGWAWRQVKGHLGHLAFYYRDLQQIFLYPHIRTFRAYRDGITNAFTALLHGEGKAALKWFLQFEKHPIHLLLTVNPQFLLLLFAWPTLIAWAPNRFLLAWAAAGFLWFLATKTRKLLFIGEGERYLEYAAYPSIFTAVQWLLLHHANALLYAWLAYALGAALFYIGTFIDETADESQAAKEMFKALNQMPDGVVWPIAWFHWQTLYASNKPVLTWGNLHKDRFTIDDFRLVGGNYPFPSDKYLEIIRRYHVTYILSNTSCLDTYLNKILHDPDAFQRLSEGTWQSGSLMLIKLRKDAIQTALEVVQSPRLSAQATPRPRILLIADVPNWIFDRHAHTLQARLADEFNIDIAYGIDILQPGQTIDESPYDLIHPLEWHMVRPDMVHTPAKWVAGIRSHTSWENQDVPRLSAHLAQLFQGGVYVVSRRLEAIFKPSLPSVERLPHGVDTTFFRSTRPPNEAAGRLKVGWAGNRASAVKGFQEFIAPLDQIPGVELVFCGYSDRLLSMAEMQEFYEGIDVYICTSASEGHNNSLMEAASMTRAIVTTDVGTVPEFLIDGSSALIVPREPTAIAEAIRKLRDNPELRRLLGTQARASVVEHFEWSTRLEGYRQFFRKAFSALPASASSTAARSRSLSRARSVSDPIPQAFLFEPRWDSFVWVEVLNRYLDAFTPEDPVALVFLMDPAQSGQIPVAEAEQLVLEVITSKGLETFPPVVLLDQPTEILSQLRLYPRASWVSMDMEEFRGLRGEFGERFSDSRLN